MGLFSELLARAREDMAGTFLVITLALLGSLKLETALNTASVCDPKERACVEASSPRTRGNVPITERTSASASSQDEAGATASQKKKTKGQTTKAGTSDNAIRHFLYGTNVHD